MFDYVDFKIDCPGCGNEVKEFQSKDGNCTLDILKPHDVNRFYACCFSCGGWIEFERKEQLSSVETIFDLKFTPKEY